MSKDQKPPGKYSKKFAAELKKVVGDEISIRVASKADREALTNTFAAIGGAALAVINEAEAEIASANHWNGVIDGMLTTIDKNHKDVEKDVAKIHESLKQAKAMQERVTLLEADNNRLQAMYAKAIEQRDTHRENWRKTRQEIADALSAYGHKIEPLDDRLTEVVRQKCRVESLTRKAIRDFKEHEAGMSSKATDQKEHILKRFELLEAMYKFVE